MSPMVNSVYKQCKVTFHRLAFTCCFVSMLKTDMFVSQRRPPREKGLHRVPPCRPHLGALDLRLLHHRHRRVQEREETPQNAQGLPGLRQPAELQGWAGAQEAGSKQQAKMAVLLHWVDEGALIFRLKFQLKSARMLLYCCGSDAHCQIKTHLRI